MKMHWACGNQMFSLRQRCIKTYLLKSVVNTLYQRGYSGGPALWELP